MNYNSQRSLIEKYQDVINAHKRWLSTYPPNLLSRWERALQDQPESAIAEAWIRSLLATHDLNPLPEEDPITGGLDFVCHLKNDLDKRFYVEATNFDSEAISKKSGLPDHMEDIDSTSSRSPYGEFRKKVRKKQKQIASHHVKEPVIVAFTCFRETDSFNSFDDSMVQKLMVPQLSGGRPCYVHSLYLDNANNGEPYYNACPDVSAVLICAPIWNYTLNQTPVVNMLLNPLASRPFNPSWAPKITCHQLSRGWENVEPNEWQVCNINVVK